MPDQQPVGLSVGRVEPQTFRDRLLRAGTMEIAEQDIGRSRRAADPGPAMYEEWIGPIPSFAESDEVGDMAGFRHHAPIHRFDDVMYAKTQMPIGMNGFGRQHMGLVQQRQQMRRAVPPHGVFESGEGGNQQ